MNYLTHAFPIGLGGVEWEEQIFINRTGSATVEGQFYQLDLEMAATETTNNIPGDEASGWANLVACTAAGSATGLQVMALEAVADNKKGRFLIQGYVHNAVCDASYDHSSAAGTVMTTNTDGELIAAADGHKPIFRPVADSADLGDGLERVAGVFSMYGISAAQTDTDA